MREPSLIERKSLLRKDLIATRSTLGQADRMAAGAALRTWILGLPEIGMAGTIAAYLSVGTEPETTALVFALWKRGSYVLLPVVREDYDLDWASYDGPDSVAPSRYGLLEPVEPSRGVEAIASADFVIVPALGAGRDGHRLGKGKGCHGRALHRVDTAGPH